MLRLEIITNSRTRSTKHLQIVNVREVDWEAWPLSEDERVRLYLLRVCLGMYSIRVLACACILE